MTLKIPSYIQNIAPYVAGKPIDEVEREYGITNSVKLASNENPLGPSPKAIKAMEEAIKRVHRYPDEPGFTLLNRIAEHTGVRPEQVIVGNGSDEILGMLSLSLLQPGDEVIVPNPSFLMYAIVTQTAGAELVTAPLNGMEIDLDGILSMVTAKTRMIFICNPNNPTGAIVRRDAFSRFMAALPDDLVVVIDEAYIQFVRDPQCANGLDYIKNDTPVVVLRTFSKAYGLAGLRVGFGVMPEKLADLLNKVRMPFNVNLVAHVAAEAALGDEAFLRQSVGLVHQSLDILYKELDERGIGYHRTQANFFLVDVSRDAGQVFEAMLREGVIVRSMAGYGFPEYIRVNIGLPEENRRFLEALDAVLV